MIQNKPDQKYFFKQALQSLIDKFRFSRLKRISNIQLDRLGDKLSSLRKVIVEIIILIFCLLFIFIIYREITTTCVIIEPFEVPQELEKQGYTGRTIANKLIDQINFIKSNTKTIMMAPQYKGSTFIPAWRQTQIEAVIPGSGITMHSIIYYIKGLFRREPVRISGELVIKRNRIDVSVRVSGNYAKFPGELENIEDSLRKAAKHIFKYLQPSILAAYLYVYESDRQACLESIQHILGHELHDDDCLAYILWGKILSDQNDYEGAIAKYKKAHELDPKQPYLYNNWGSALLQQKDYEGAIDKFNEAIKIDPTNPNNYIVYSNLGSALLQKGEFERANEEFQKAKKLKPDLALGTLERENIRQLR